MKRIMTIPAIAACALAVAPATASAGDGLAGERVGVCDDRLELNREPNQGREGVLFEGQSVDVRKLSESGKYAYGFAYGDINRVGWVLTSGLCGGEAARAGADDDGLVGERVPVTVERLELNREPNQGWDGVLFEGQTFDVRKLSESGKYAYGFAYGDINRVGWVLTSGLEGGGGG